MVECKDCRVTPCVRTKAVRRTCVVSRSLKPKEDKLVTLAQSFRVETVVINEILADGAEQPDVKRLPILQRSLEKLSRQDNGKILLQKLDPAWFKRGKVDLTLARQMITRPEDYL